jgi:hypothetical protein
VFRGIVFQFLGLASIGAYLRLYREFAAGLEGRLKPAPAYVGAGLSRPSESS